MKIEIKHANQEDINKLDEWIFSEWGESSPVDKMLSDENLPIPILAYKDNNLVGGLKFSYFKRSKSEEKTLWINALYITPSSRRQGIAKMLVSKAKDVSIDTNYNELFVYTKFPELYLNLGWDLIESKDNDHTLRSLLKKR